MVVHNFMQMRTKIFIALVTILVGQTAIANQHGQAVGYMSEEMLIEIARSNEEFIAEAAKDEHMQKLVYVGSEISYKDGEVILFYQAVDSVIDRTLCFVFFSMPVNADQSNADQIVLEFESLDCRGHGPGWE